MIRYTVTPEELSQKIELVAPGWLTKARRKTARFKSARKYSERTSSWSVVKEAFINLQFGKCAYCERFLEVGNVGLVEWDIEHFRPKSRVQAWPPADSDLRSYFAFGMGPASSKGYYLLSYQPLNYLAVCKVCNSPIKADYFPIAAKRRRLAEASVFRLVKEHPYLVYPISDLDQDPEQLITFQGFVCVPVAARGPRRLRALVVIAFFRLNERDTLLKERAEVIIKAFMALERVSADPTDALARSLISQMRHASHRHSNCTRSFCRTYWIDKDVATVYVEKSVTYLSSLN